MKTKIRMNDSEIGIACGRPIPKNNPDSLVGMIVQTLWTAHDLVFAEMDKRGQLRHASEIYCIRKKIAKKIPENTVNDDAYLALTAVKQGWNIVYEPQATVLIRGPETISDYFKQRRRIIWGHNQVRKLTGKSPQHVLHMIPLNPSGGFKLLLKLFSELGLLSFAVFIILEIIINIVVIVDSISGKSHVKWDVADSTKKL